MGAYGAGPIAARTGSAWPETCSDGSAQRAGGHRERAAEQRAEHRAARSLRIRRRARDSPGVAGRAGEQQRRPTRPLAATHIEHGAAPAHHPGQQHRGYRPDSRARTARRGSRRGRPHASRRCSAIPPTPPARACRRGRPATAADPAAARRGSATSSRARRARRARPARARWPASAGKAPARPARPSTGASAAVEPAEPGAARQQDQRSGGGEQQQRRAGTAHPDLPDDRRQRTPQPHRARQRQAPRRRSTGASSSRSNRAVDPDRLPGSRDRTAPQRSFAPASPQGLFERQMQVLQRRRAARARARSARSIARVSERGRSPRRRSSGSSRLPMRRAVAAGVAPRTGLTPESPSYRTSASEYRSAGAPASRPSLCSGAI